MNILELNLSVKGHQRRKRVGRGAASGMGKTSGRGSKGMGSRTGANYLRNFVGGQTQLKARFAKRGFNNKVFATVYVPVNIGWLEATFEAGTEVTPELVATKGVSVRRGELLKVLGTGEIKKALTVKAHAFSKAAAEKIAAAGGKTETLPLEGVGPRKPKTVNSEEK